MKSLIIYSIIVLCSIFLPELHANNLTGKKTVNLLVIHSFDNNLADYPEFNRMIAENLEKENIPVETQFFYLDCDAFDKEGELQRIRNYLDTLSMAPDIMLVCNDQATYSLLASGHPLVKKTPVVFSGVNFPNWDLLKSYPNVTGIWDNPDYEKNAQMIEKLLGVKRIRFFYDKTYNGKRVIKRLADQYKSKDRKLYSSLTHFLQNQDSIKNDFVIDPKTTNIYLKGNDSREQRPIETSFHFMNMRDELGWNLLWNISGTFRYSVFLLTRYDFTIAQVGLLATVPTFSAINRGFGHNQGILGGYFTPAGEQTKQACGYLARIINGESVSNLPVKMSTPSYLLDWEVMKRWNIRAEQVPEEFEIVNMPLYVKYQTEAIVFLSILTVSVLSLLFYLFFLYRREAKRKRQAQLNLWEEKEFLSLALEGGNIFAWRYDREKNEFTFDHDFLVSVGITSEIIHLKELTRMTHPNEQNNAVSTFINVVNGIESRANLRVRIDFNGNGYLWYEFRILNISGMLGNKTSVIGLVMNIQDYKNKEEELIEARDLASKAELKQSFLANMSHEIRTPLNAIVGFSNILVSDESLPNEEKLDFIRIINKNCELLLNLINDILEISRIESGNISFNFDPCDLNELVNDVYNMCSLQTPPGVEFVKETLEEPLVIDTDIVRLKQVVANFVNNAFKFTSCGSVSVRMSKNETEKEVSICVEDTGAGIPESEQKMIFERFYKVDEFAQGTGLGLSISQVIADKLGGRITLTSEVGKGSCFCITLSYAGKPDDEPENEAMPGHAPAEEPATAEVLPVVLIAEDSVNNYMVLDNILKKICTVVWVTNGKDVLEVIKKRKIDLILMDIKMHEMDGITALKKIRKKFKKLPVIFQTAYAFEENRELAMQAGGSEFLAKPIRQEELLKVLGRYIRIGGKK